VGFDLSLMNFCSDQWKADVRGAIHRLCVQVYNYACLIVLCPKSASNTRAFATDSCPLTSFAYMVGLVGGQRASGAVHASDRVSNVQHCTSAGQVETCYEFAQESPTRFNVRIEDVPVESFAGLRTCDSPICRAVVAAVVVGAAAEAADAVAEAAVAADAAAAVAAAKRKGSAQGGVRSEYNGYVTRARVAARRADRSDDRYDASRASAHGRTVPFSKGERIR
jgi:hypothetical protein